MNATTIRTAPILAAAAFAAVTARASVFDDAKFILDLRGGENGYSKPGNIGNALDFSSSSSPCVGYMGDFAGAKTYTSVHDRVPQQLETEVVNPLSPATTNTQNALHFFQDTKSSTQSARTSVCISNAAVNASTVTFYVRFKWDGIAPGSESSWPCYIFENGKDGDGNKASGVALSIAKDTSIANTTTNGYLAFRGAAKADNLTTLTVKVGMWNDAFITYTRNSDNTEYTVTGSICSTSTSKPTLKSQSVSKTGALSFATPNIVLGGYHNTSGGATTTRGFRGVIAEFMAWDRALTDEEKLEVMAGPAALGGRWQIGAANGSADEFGDDDPADLYDVRSMPWRRMRKTLDASTPSLSISTTMTADDAKRNRTLTLTPILSGASSAPVEVALNGTVVGSIDLASETSITLPRRLWLHGSGLANTITVTRTAPLSGTVRLDAVSLATGDYGEAGGVLEDATFKLDLRGGESTFTQPGDLGNALDFSAASPLAGYMGDQRGPQTYDANFGNLPAQETADVQNPYYPYTTNTQTVLHFYQDFKGEDKGSVNSGIVLPGAAPKGLTQTYYLRFRWDGVAPAATGETAVPVYILQSGQSSNGNNVNNGVAINLNGITVSGATTNAVLACRVGASGTSRYPEMTATISAGKWVDAFVTFEANADNTGFTTTFSVCSPSPTGGNFNPPSLVTQVVSSSGGLSFDSTNLSFGLYHNSQAPRDTTRCFRGLIADFMTWERALTDAEKIEVMSGRHGAKWMVGSANGSADEFTDDAPAAVFEPESMPWRRMRRTLTAANPTLTLKSPLAEQEADRPMLFTLASVPDGAAHPVRVAVNGALVGDFDAATDGTIIIPRGSWTRDGSGDVTVTATSLNTSAPLSIDAIALSGSWQNAPDGGGSNGMLNEKYSPRVAFAGDTDVEHFTSSLSVGSSLFSTNFTFGVWVPKGMGDKVGWKFRTKTTSLSNPIDGLDARHVVYVNGTAVGLHNGWFKANEPFTLDIPAGVLRDGMNYVQWVQTLPTRAEQQAVTGRPGVYQYYDYWGMTLVPPAFPFVIIMR